MTAISEAVGGPTFSSSFTYDVNSNLTNEGLKSSGVTLPITLTYDNSSRLTGLVESSPITGAAGLANTFSYSYDGLNRTSNITAKVNGVSTSTALTHDALGELLTAGSKTYSYQPNGNLQSATGGGVSETYSYSSTDQPDELTGYGVTAKSPLFFSYDNNGTGSITSTQVISSSGLPMIISTNPISSADCLAGVPDTHSTCLSYDGRDRLSQVKLANGSNVSMTYNTAGQRASYTVVLSAATTLQELFTYRGDQVGQVTYSGTSITTPYTDTYLYLGASTPYELIRQYPTKVTCGGASTLTCKYWYILDGRGNVVALTDTTGTVVDRYSYDVWGLPTISLETVKQPLLYAGYWYDRELGTPNETTGWYWLSVRSYDPVLKRFLQPDPSGQDGLRSYVYVGDDPVDGTDAAGTWGLSGWACVFVPIGPVACGAEWFWGHGGRGVYSFVIGDDLEAVTSGHPVAMGLGAVDLVSNVLFVLPFVGEGSRAGIEGSRAGIKVATEGMIKVILRTAAHRVADDETARVLAAALTKLSRAEILARNKIAGDAAERLVKQELEQQGAKIVGTKVSVRTSKGLRRIDILLQQRDGSLTAIEVKSGSAYRSTAQVEKDATLELNGGLFVGKNCGNLLGKRLRLVTIVFQR